MGNGSPSTPHNRPMHLVVVSQSSTFGGAERYLNRLFSRLRVAGDEPLLVGHVPGWDEEALRHVGVRLGPKWSKSTMIGGLLRLPAERRRVVRAVRAREVDLFHLQFKREQIGFTKALAKLGPVVWTEHGQFLQGVSGRLLASRYRVASRYVAAIICVSEAVATDVRAVVADPSVVHVIENGVGDGSSTPATPAARTAARQRLGVAEDVPVVLWIGRLHSAKRPEMAVRLAGEFEGVVLIAGEGPERAALERTSSSMTNVRLLGHLDEPELAYAAADAVFFTSSSAAREGLPTTLVEAASHALPVVAVADTGLDELMTELGAEVAPSGSGPHEWARAIHRATAERERSRSRMVAWAGRHSEESWVGAHRARFESTRSSWTPRSQRTGSN